MNVLLYTFVIRRRRGTWSLPSDVKMFGFLGRMRMQNVMFELEDIPMIFIKGIPIRLLESTTIYRTNTSIIIVDEEFTRS